MLNSAAYIQENRLCIIGVHPSKIGPIPFSHSVLIEGEPIPDGPVHIDNNEALNPAIEKALQDCDGAIMRKVRLEEMERAAADLVVRARAGDQVAMGILAMVRTNALKGSKRAKVAYRYLQRYVKAHPVTDAMSGFEAALKSDRLAKTLESSIGTENPLHYSSAVVAMVPDINATSLTRAAVVLANGPDLCTGKDANPRISALHSSFAGEDEHKAFRFGVATNDISKIYPIAQRSTPKQNRALQIGYAVGLARRIQAVRRPNVPIAVISKMAAWELGE